mmetsp:Transcript_90996/g.259769  ORF Transcript_90996/g.259769 Transcript_90996/m.259769 type:complete len:284 (+) Transcript_90996:145-996(+)
MAFADMVTSKVNLILEGLPPLTDYVPAIPTTMVPVVWFTLGWMCMNMIMHVISYAIAGPTYKKLPLSEKLTWMGWGVTTLHTLVIFTLCYPLVDELYPLWMAGSMTFVDSPDTIAKAALPMSVFMGYILSDVMFVSVAIMMRGRFEGDDAGFMVHHLAIIVTWYMALTQAKCRGFCIGPMMCEVTQPLLGLRYYMAKYKNFGLIFTINGITLLVMWWVFRIGGYVIVQGMSVVNSAGMIMEDPLRVLLVINWAIGGVLQVFWGVKILTAALRFLLPKKKDKTK